MADELGCTKQERQEVIVIETPNSVTACGLEHVLHLHFSHEVDVSVEKASD